MDTKWKKVLRLIKKSGDKAIVMDNESEEAFVVLALSDYERLTEKAEGVVDLTEEQFLDRINQDINKWSQENEKDQPPLDKYSEEQSWLGPELESSDNSNWSLKEKAEEEDDQYYIEPVE